MAKIINLNNFQDTLEAYIQSGNLNFLIGSGASLPAIGLMGDIESSIDELLSNEQDLEADSMALEFIQKIEVQSGLREAGSSSPEIEITINNYVKFLSIIDEILFERKNILLPRQANIFTTNYDLFIENAGTRVPSLMLNDGFDRSSSIKNVFRFSPEKFLDRTYRSGSIYTKQSEIPTVNLFKIHGSINWCRLNNEIGLLKELPEILTGADLTIHTRINKALSDRAMVLPNVKKFGSTLIDRVYYDLLRFFANSIEKENSVLIAFGFSFSDEHIYDITKRSLRNPTSQLIIYAYDDHAVEQLSVKFESQRNAIIVSNNKGAVIGYEEFNRQLSNVLSKRLDADE